MIDRVDEWNELGDNEKADWTEFAETRQWQRQLRKCGRSNLLHLSLSSTSPDLYCLFK